MDVQGATTSYGCMSAARVAFRVDASLIIGTGHVMRCLTLAGSLRALGCAVFFISREHPGNLTEIVRAAGFPVRILPGCHREEPPLPHPSTSHLSWLGADWALDAQQTQVALGAGSVDWLVVDHYGLDARWESQLQSSCRHLMVVDDLADRPHSCTVLLDQNLGRSPQDYSSLVPASCRLLVGPQFALLRPDFAARRALGVVRRYGGEAPRILIAMGGVDRDNITTRMLNALAHRGLPEGSTISVVLGVHAPWSRIVEEMAAKMPCATRVLVGVSNMADLVADSDIAIGAAGGSAWERCCLGLPTLMMVLADNQRDGASALVKAGAALLLDNDFSDGDFAGKLSQILCPEQHAAMREACLQITDGSGADRMARIIADNDV